MTDPVRCPQCWSRLPPSAFATSRKGTPFKVCEDCRARYRGWAKLSPAERLERKKVARRGLDPAARLRVTFIARSLNKKLGGIPASISSASTCPPACGFFGAGCFAEYHLMRLHWSRVPERGMTWSAFCSAVAALPPAQLWRHNEAGDLPGEGNAIDENALFRLVAANDGRRGFTFTHKPVLPEPGFGDAFHNAMVVQVANANGFTINLSADSLEQADALAELGIAPVAVVLPSDAPLSVRTPAGRRVVVCPAETAQLTCAECELCAHPNRKSIVGFRAHGQAAAQVSALVRLRT